MGYGRVSGVSGRQGRGTAGLQTLRGGFQTGLQGEKRRQTPQRRARRLWTHAGVGVVERAYLLAEAGRGNGRGNGRQFEMA
jgi:hypothetical protein